MKPLKSKNGTVHPKKTKRLWVRFMIVFLILIAVLSPLALGVYGVYIERGMLLAEKQAISLAKAEPKTSLRVVHFTDTHLGPFFSLKRLETLVEAINEQEADIVVFTGDLVDKPRTYKQWWGATGILAKIKAPLGKYAVPGNHDNSTGPANKVESMLNDSGFEFLRNRSTEISLPSGLLLRVVGLDDAQSGKSNYAVLPTEQADNERCIVLAHSPDMALQMKKYEVDLVLSGHTHGGQVRLPLIGALYLPPHGKQFSRGLYQTDFGMQVYVDSGAGETGLPVRLGVPPQFSVLQLQL